jgi:hypothetical protein
MTRQRAREVLTLLALLVQEYYYMYELGEREDG